MADIIDGRKIAEDIKREVREETALLKSKCKITPGLAFILVGDNPASESYIRSKEKSCSEAGFYSVTERMSTETSQSTLLERIRQFNNDPKIHGLLVQLPLPKHFNEAEIIEAIDPKKDVDGFHPYNVGKLMIGEDTLKPCTPAGIQEMLIRSGNDPAGKHVVIVGRSNIVGKPVANILFQKQAGANAVVTVAHTGAKDLSIYTKSADILIAAIGRPRFITGAMLRPGVVVIDVGINRVTDATAKNGYRIVGDVDFESASQVAKAITPVPGGVGLMTVAMLMKNTLKAARNTTTQT